MLRESRASGFYQMLLSSENISRGVYAPWQISLQASKQQQHTHELKTLVRAARPKIIPQESLGPRTIEFRLWIMALSLSGLYYLSLLVIQRCWEGGGGGGGLKLSYTTAGRKLYILIRLTGVERFTRSDASSTTLRERVAAIHLCQTSARRSTCRGNFRAVCQW